MTNTEIIKARLAVARLELELAEAQAPTPTVTPEPVKATPTALPNIRVVTAPTRRPRTATGTNEGRTWKPEEDALILASSASFENLAVALGRTRRAVRDRSLHLRKEVSPAAPLPLRATNSPRPFTAEEVEAISDTDLSIDDLCALFPERTKGSLYAKRWSLRKNA